MRSHEFDDGGVRGAEVHYRGHEFEPSPGEAFAGRLVLDDRRRERLAAEADDWCLDDDGERLPADWLFALSPWSRPGPSGPEKLLSRFLDLRDGTVRFHTPDLYGGDLFRWMRSGPESQEGG